MNETTSTATAAWNDYLNNRGHTDLQTTHHRESNMSNTPNTATEKDLGLKIVECDGCPLTQWGCTHHIIGFERDHVERGISSIEEAQEMIDYIHSTGIADQIGREGGIPLNVGVNTIPHCR